MKRILFVFGILLMSGLFTLQTVHAGPARRHTIEGIILGTGAAILGTVIYNEIKNDHKTYPPRACKRPSGKRFTHHHRHGKDHYAWNRHKHGYAKWDRHHPGCKKCRKEGYWKIKRVWVEPVKVKKWIPGHFNRKGKFKKGRYKKVVEKGYWTNKTVWVRH